MEGEVAVEEQIAPLLHHLKRESPGDVVGIYLFGSAVSSGLQPDSDIDVLMMTRRSLFSGERVALLQVLLAISGWKGHAGRFPDAVDRRPIELTSLVIEEAQQWTVFPRRDFLYGEWLREELLGGHVPLPEDDPDVIPLVATAYHAHTTLHGPALSELLAPVPSDLLRKALVATIPDTLANLEGDERNVLLTLARILVTLDTGRIVSKDAAADAIAPSLSPPDRALMDRARGGYLGVARDDWSTARAATDAFAQRLAQRAKERGSS